MLPTLPEAYGGHGWNQRVHVRGYLSTPASLPHTGGSGIQASTSLTLKMLQQVPGPLGLGFWPHQLPACLMAPPHRPTPLPSLTCLSA